MVRMLNISALLAAAFLMCGCQEENTQKKTNTEDPTPTPVVVEEESFAYGADISWVTEMESDGKTFKNASGQTEDLYSILSGIGMNAIRLRIWVDPDEGWCGKEDVVKKAVRAVNAGMDVMVDFHYSDYFADPGKQNKPDDWASISTSSALAEKVAEHTTEVLTALKTAGVTPKWIQIGNETRNGMLWATGQLWTDNGDIVNGWTNYATISNAGYEAAKKIFSDAYVFVHLNKASEDLEWWFTKFKNAGGKFDMIGLSHYPQSDDTSSDAYTLNTKAINNIQRYITAFSCPVMVCETGVKVSDVTTGAAVMADFVGKLEAIDNCLGVFYWEPEVYGGWKPARYTTDGWNAYDMGAFSASGQPTAILDCFGK